MATKFSLQNLEKQPYIMLNDKRSVGRSSMVNECKFSQSTIMIIGNRGCGKTTLIHKLLQKINQESSLELIQVLAHNSSEYQQIPETLVKTSFDYDHLDKYIEAQTKKIYLEKKQFKFRGGSQSGALIVDGLVPNPNYFKSKEVKSLYINNKHFGTTFITSMDHYGGISPLARTNLEYIFVFGGLSIYELKKIYDHYDSGCNFASFENFHNDYKKNTSGAYEFMMINLNSVPTTEKSSYYYYYGSVNPIEVIYNKTHKLKLKPIYWKFDKIIREKAKDYNSPKQSDQSNQYIRMSPKLIYPSQYQGLGTGKRSREVAEIDSDIEVKGIKISPEYKCQKPTLKYENVILKKPKIHRSTPLCDEFQLKEIIIDPPLD